MTNKQLLAKIGDFFELQQTHYIASTVGTNVDLAAQEAEARQEIADRGEGDSPLTSDVAAVLSELEDQVDTVADDPLEEIDDQSPDQVVAEIKNAIKALAPEVTSALFWNTGQAEKSKFTFMIHTRDGSSLGLLLEYD